MLRIVLDTNVLVSAILRDGKPRKLFQMGIDGKYQILTSRETINELTEVLHRPKFKMTEEEVNRIVSALRVTGERVNVTSTLQVVSRDIDDNIIINTAFDGNADHIVSGDKDVKEIKSFKGIKIVSVDEMLKILQ